MSTSDSASKTHASVIIIGAGPVGMLIALRLGQAGVDTLVIEGHDTLLNTTRAMVYMPVVIPVLKEFGILDTVLREAYLNTTGVTWRDVNGAALANLPLGSPHPDEFSGVLQLGQWRMNTLILAELRKYPSVAVRFGCKLTSITDNPDFPFVDLTAYDPKDPDPSSSLINLTSNYVVGTDGANSTTRRLLSIPTDGFTYTNFRMIGIDVIYDFMAHEDFDSLNFVVHPQDWAVIAYTGQDEGGLRHGTINRPQWRVAYGEDPSLPDDPASIWQRAQAQMSKYARSSAQGWKMLRAEPYTISQRAAAVPIQGRVMLAGDALHTNNPIGGLGLTGGILDAFCYGNALTRVVALGEAPPLLTRCAHSRLDAWKTSTDQLSQTNLERLYGVDDASRRARETLFAKLNDERSRHGVAQAVRDGIDAMLPETFLDAAARTNFVP